MVLKKLVWAFVLAHETLCPMKFVGMDSEAFENARLPYAFVLVLKATAAAHSGALRWAREATRTGHASLAR
jgi:hypothetical protein